MSRVKALLLALAAALLVPGAAHAGKCSGTFVDMIGDINWQCAFPIRIGGVMRIGSGIPEEPDPVKNVACKCIQGGVPRVGITASFWEPSRMIDTVVDPWCFMAIGTKAHDSNGKLAGGTKDTPESKRTFAQMHYYKFPAWAMLDMFNDVPCLDKSGKFDIAFVSEVMPNWNSDIFSLLVNPEAILFGNPATQLACIADSASAVFDKPISPLFWCMGSWGSTYPLTGTIGNPKEVVANAGLAARGLYLTAREGVLLDAADNMCTQVYTPIWKKGHYRFQAVKPVRQSSCMNIGKPGLLWDAGLNIPMAGDNFNWLVFRQVKCCVFAY